MLSEHLQPQDYIDLIDDYLEKSDQLIVILLNHEMKIKKCSPAIIKLFRTEDDIIGKNLKEFMLEESRIRIDKAVESLSGKVKLNFNSASHQTFSLICFIYKVNNDEILIFGEQPYLGSDEIIERMSVLNNDLANISRELSRKNKELEDAKKKIKVLSGTLPVCSYCKKIRDHEGKWFQLESYIDKHSEAQFSHTICPVCMEKEFPE